MCLCLLRVLSNESHHFILFFFELFTAVTFLPRHTGQFTSGHATLLNFTFCQATLLIILSRHTEIYVLLRHTKVYVLSSHTAQVTFYHATQKLTFWYATQKFTFCHATLLNFTSCHANLLTLLYVQKTQRNYSCRFSFRYTIS